MKFSVCAFFDEAFSTSSSIFDTVESSKSLVVFTFRVPLSFIQPLMISSPTFTDRGTDSPVSAAVFNMEEPSMTTPSKGTFSPGSMVMMVPTSTSSGST